MAKKTTKLSKYEAYGLAASSIITFSDSFGNFAEGYLSTLKDYLHSKDGLELFLYVIGAKNDNNDCAIHEKWIDLDITNIKNQMKASFNSISNKVDLELEPPKIKIKQKNIKVLSDYFKCPDCKHENINPEQIIEGIYICKECNSHFSLNK